MPRQSLQLSPLSLLVSGLLLSTALAHAATEAPEPKALALATTLSLSTNAIDPDSSLKTADLFLALRPSWRITSKKDPIGPLAILGSFSMTKSFVDDRTLLVDDSLLGVAHLGVALGGGVAYSPRISFVIPTSDLSRRAESLITGVRAEQQFQLLQGPEWAPGLSGFFSITPSYLFYQYSTSIAGESNRPFRLGFAGNLTYTLWERLSIGATISETLSFTVQGTPFSTFRHMEEIGYAITENFQIAVGHSNSGPAFADNGRDLAIRLIDPLNSSFYASLNLNL